MFHRLLKSVSMNMLNLFTKLSGLIFWLFDQPCKHLLFWFQDLWKIIMLRHSGCWYFDKMSFGQFGSGDDVIAGASVQRARDWTDSGHTNATLKCYHQIFTLQLQCSTTSVEKCTTLFMIMSKTVWCWKWNAIIALPMLCAEYTCPTMFFLGYRPRLFVWSVLDNVQGTLFANSSGADGFSTRICTRGII